MVFDRGREREAWCVEPGVRAVALGSRGASGVSDGSGGRLAIGGRGAAAAADALSATAAPLGKSRGATWRGVSGLQIVGRKEW
jgi:hypothetical protein